MAEHRKSVEQMLRDGQISLAIVPEPSALFDLSAGGRITWSQVYGLVPPSAWRSWLDKHQDEVPDLRDLLAAHGIRQRDHAVRPAVLVWPGPQIMRLRTAGGAVTREDVVEAAKVLLGLQARDDARKTPVSWSRPAYEYMPSQPERFNRVKYGKDIPELSG